MNTTTNRLFMLISAIVLLCMSLPVQASHIVGSDVSYKCTSTPGIFEVTLILYRDCDGVPLCPGGCGDACTQSMTLEGADSGYATQLYATISLNLVNVRDVYINNDCPGVKNTCTNMGCVAPGIYSPAIERYEFKGMVNIGSTSGIPSGNCNVRVSWNACCRTTDIATGAANTNFYTHAIINRCLSVNPCNSSPVFANDPYSVICGGTGYQFNNGSVDPDLDSLSYSFAPSLIGFGTSVPYTPPFSFDKPMPWTGNPTGEFPAGINCDPQSGEIRFTPPLAGQTFTGVMAIEVKQWRRVNGVPAVVGITRRDMQMIVDGNCAPDNVPYLTTSPPADGSVNRARTDWRICAGEQLCFTITARDTDFNPPSVSDTTYLSWNASLARLGATFHPNYDIAKRRLADSLGGGPREDRYLFCWTPHDSVASSVPYYFTVNGKDNRCPKPALMAQSFSITVLPRPDVTIHKSVDSCGRLMLSFTNNKPNMKLKSYSWKITPRGKDINNPPPPHYYQNQNNVLFQVKDSGLLHIELMLEPYDIKGVVCPRIISDSIRTSQTSLFDSIVKQNVSCKNASDGKITIFVFNGIPPYSYSLDNGPTRLTNQFSQLPAGKHVVLIKDTTGCTIQREINIEVPYLADSVIEGMESVILGSVETYSAKYKDSTTAVWVATNGTILSGRTNTQTIQVRWDSVGVGIVSLMVSDSNGTTSITKLVTVGTTGIREIGNPLGIKMFPNPAQSVLYITSHINQPETKIRLYNMLGMLVLERELNTSQELNIEKLPKGIYIVKIGEWSGQVVKE